MNFDQLRAANIARLSVYSCDDWTPADWLTAFVGEVGEAANIAKKIRRGDFSGDPAKQALAMQKLEKEFADIQTYLDLWAWKYGIDLGEATRDKWNEVSSRVGSNLSIDAAGELCQGVERGSPGNRNIVPGLQLHQCEIRAGMLVRYGAHEDDLANIEMPEDEKNDGESRATSITGGDLWISASSLYGLKVPSIRDHMRWRKKEQARRRKTSVDMR